MVFRSLFYLCSNGVDGGQKVVFWINRLDTNTVLTVSLKWNVSILRRDHRHPPSPECGMDKSKERVTKRSVSDHIEISEDFGWVNLLLPLNNVTRFSTASLYVRLRTTKIFRGVWIESDPQKKFTVPLILSLLTPY